MVFMKRIFDVFSRTDPHKDLQEKYEFIKILSRELEHKISAIRTEYVYLVKKNRIIALAPEPEPAF